MISPKNLFSFEGLNGEKIIVMKCTQHGSHVVLGFGKSELISCLHLHVPEAMDLIDVLRAGVTWAKLELQQPLPGHPEADGDRQAGNIVRDGGYAVTVRGQQYMLSLVPKALPAVVAVLGPNARERICSALLELVHGKVAAA